MMTKQQGALILLAASLGVAVGMGTASYFFFQSSVSAPSVASNALPVPPEVPISARAVDAPLLITTMTHMEEDFKDDQDRALFDRHVANMRWAMDLFDEYGAKLTFESEQPFARANRVWGLNILKEVIERGHGVGTHAGFGATRGSTLTVDQLSEKFKENKALVDALVGVENNRGVSGGTGPTDWVVGASAAGFAYVDAVTAFGYLAMPISARPSGWDNQYILKTVFHDPIPPLFSDRLYPIPLKNAKDLVPDESPVIVMMGGDLGELASLAEGRINCTPNCIFDETDITAVTDAIDEANSLRDRSRVARINVHIPLKLLDRGNESLLRMLLGRIETYVDAGTVRWETQGGSYDRYRAWK